MNKQALQRKQLLEAKREALLQELDNPNLSANRRLDIAIQLREMLDESSSIDLGAHELRGNTATESKDLFAAVQRELSGKKVLR